DCNGEEKTLTVGEQWACGPPEASVEAAGSPTREPPPNAESKVEVAPRPTTEVGEVAPARGSAVPAERSSLLAEQNRLLAAAMDARKHGDDQGAVRMLDDFLSKYRASPVAEVALVERFRALEHAGNHAEAAREARRYLAAYRDGFAREEARRLAL